MDRGTAAPSWAGVPKGITIFATPDGWRHSLVTENGGFLCGKLRGLPPDASDEDAKSAADAMIQGLALEFHGLALAVTWTPGQSPHAWDGQTRRVETEDV